MTDKAAYRQGLPDTIAVDYIPFFDEAAPERSTEIAVNHFKYYLKRHPGKYAAIWLELIQGEGGYYPGQKQFFQKLMTAARENGVAVIADEVQTFGRTSRPYAFQHFGVDDLVDIVTVGKITQVCATLFTDQYAPQPGLISQTFTGSNMTILAANAILQGLVDAGNFGNDGKNMSLHKHFADRLTELSKKHPGCISGPFGIGGMVAFTPFDGSSKKTNELIDRLYAAGLMSFMAGGNPSRVRFLLPLGCIETQHIDVACEIIDHSGWGNGCERMSVNAADQSGDDRERFGDLFPLPLRSFEELFVHDDNGPVYPSVFSMRFYFEGEFDDDFGRKGFSKKSWHDNRC